MTQETTENTKTEDVDVTALFSDIKILGKHTLSNRIALAPMTRGRATTEFIPTDIMKTYYEQRSDALLITEGTGISPQGLGWYKAPGIWSNKQTEEWKKITNGVHSKNGVIGLQLWHMGRQAHTHVTQQKHIVSASPIPLTGTVTTKPTDENIKNGILKSEKKPYEVPYPLLNENGGNGDKEYKCDDDYKATISDVVKDFGIAAKNSINAGFDFVEIHGANGYLVDQFIQSVSNKRTDGYGGNINNRLRFMREVVKEVIKQVGNKPQLVGIRLSPNGVFGGMGSKDNNETFSEAIKWLSQQKIGFIHLLDGLGYGFHKLFDPYTLKMAKDIITKNNTDKNNPTILIGNVGYTKELANKQIKEGNTDMIAFGRPFISNPDLVKRFKNNWKLNETAKYEFWWGIDKGSKGYIDYPFYKE